jgi:hypothetical protein
MVKTSRTYVVGFKHSVQKCFTYFARKNNNKNLSNIGVIYVKIWRASFKQPCPYQLKPREMRLCANFLGVVFGYLWSASFLNRFQDITLSMFDTVHCLISYLFAL